MNKPPSATTNRAVQKRLMLRFFPGALSLLLAAAWLLASNHCAVAALAQPHSAKASHEHCVGHAADSGKPQKDNGCDDQNCCKSLTAPAVVLAKSPVSFDQSAFVAVDYFAALFPGHTDLHPVVVFELDTGPPQATSFAVSVLQRSLLGHAPPSLA
ncbi:MAG: hypothetical protein ABI883_09325 [Chthoniobacterales bacterium]